MEFFDFKFEGLDELNKTINEMAKALNPDKVEAISNKGARKLAAAIRARAPDGPTGNLKKGVKAKQLERLGNSPAPSIATVDRKRAPHAYLVEYGTSGIRIGKRGSKKYRGKSFGRMPANPFFRSTLDEKGPGVLNDVVKGLEKLIEGAVK